MHRDDIAAAYGEGRMTTPRRAIAQAVERMPGAFSIEELAASLRLSDRTTGATATVYRAVAAMEASGFLERVGSRDGAALFARCAEASHHHHHIVCDVCGRTASTPCSLSVYQGAAAESGFVVTRHELTLYGLCPACSAGTD